MENQIKKISDFALSKKFSDIPENIILQLKSHLLDAIGSMLFSINENVPSKVEKTVSLLSNIDAARFPIQLPANFAAQYYTSLIRYPDFMDNFLAKESTCHPSDNIGALLSVAHLKEISGEDLLTAMAIAYEIECRLTEQMPVMIKGYDHTALLAFSATAGIAKLLDLTVDQTMNALGMAGCSFNPLVSSRASYTTQWKGLASSLVNEGCVNLCLLAKEGVTGPIHLFEIPEKGYNAIYGMSLAYDWEKEGFDLVRRCSLKSYNAEVHTQSAISAALELKNKYRINPSEITKIDVKTFLTAYHIVGGGEYGSRKLVRSKEQADHSLPYVIAAALLDNDLYPEQLTPERIKREDVQDLLKKVNVHTGFPLHKPVKLTGLLDPYTSTYPDKLKTSVTISVNGGQDYTMEKEDYKGYYTNPMSWDEVVNKFKRLTDFKIGNQDPIIEAVASIENYTANDLLKLLFLKQ